MAVHQDDVLYRLGWHTSPFESPGEAGFSYLNSALRLEHSPVATDRGPNRLPDYRFASAHRCRPPVTSRTVPVMYDERSEARNNATLATSLGSPALPIGTSATFASQIRCGIASVIADLIRPGWIALTRTPRWASSFDAALVIPTMPALAAE